MPVRHEYRLKLAAASPDVARPPAGTSIRAISVADTLSLAALMLEAYRDTVDYEGEGIAEAVAEVEGYFSSTAQNPAMPQLSVALTSGELTTCACMLKFWRSRDIPLVGYVMCLPKYKHQGLATLALRAVIANLRRAGYAEVRAVITEGNVPSEALFARAGFRRVAQ